MISLAWLSIRSESHYFLNMIAHYNLLQNKPQLSQKYYQELLIEAPVYAYKGFVQFLFATEQYKEIALLIPKLQDQFKDDLSVQLIFGQSLAEIGQEEAASQKFISLQQKHKSNQELTYLAAVSYSKTSPQKAIDVISEYLNSAPMQPRDCIFYFLLSQLFMSLNNRPQAIEHVKKSLDLCPRFDKGWLFLGLIQEQEGHINDAIAGYTRYLQLTGSDKRVEYQLQKLLVQSKMTSPMNGLGSTQNIKSSSCLTSALSWYELGSYENALYACDNCLKEHPDNQDARLLKVHIFSAMNQPLQAADLLQSYMLHEPHNEAWYKALHLLHHAGLPSEKVSAVLQTVEKKHPGQALPVLYLADLYTRIWDTDKAITYHKKATTLTNNELLKVKILFNLASIYFETDKYAEMKKTIDQAYGLNIEFPPLNNLLAYYYASKGSNISQAQHHLDLALKNDSQNPHFLDTQALIWYRKHEYTKAADLLKKVAAAAPADYFIHYHLAKTFHKLGSFSEAYTIMKKTLELAHTQQQKAKCNFFIEQWKK